MTDGARKRDEDELRINSWRHEWQPRRTRSPAAGARREQTERDRERGRHARLAVGAKETSAYRVLELRLPEFLVGRKDTCNERIAGQIVSSVHVSLTLARRGDNYDDDAPLL